MFVLICFSAFFSGSETAFFSIDRETLRKYRKSPRTSRRMVAGLMREPRNLLIALLFSNLIVNVLYLSIGSVIGMRIAEGGSGVLALVWGIAVLAILICFGEITPKIIARQFAKPVAAAGVRVVYVLQKLLYPATYFLGHLADAFTRTCIPSSRHSKYVTEDELKFLATMSRAHGVIDRRQERMLVGMINLSATLVRDVMTPHVDIVAYDADGPPEGLLERARASGRRRIPIYEGSLDNIIGVVHAKDVLLDGKGSLRVYVRPVSFVPELKSALSLLNFFRETRKVIAIAVDEYGQTAGLVTLEDIVEEIVGDIQDESDVQEEQVTELPGNKYLVSGALSVQQWQELFEEELPASSLEKFYSQVSTLGGLVTLLFQKIPKVGESVEFKNIRFTVKEMRKRRISRILVEYVAPHQDAREGT
jgi:CBS domain containing-hemolysin-like protein